MIYKQKEPDGSSEGLPGEVHDVDGSIEEDQASISEAFAKTMKLLGLPNMAFETSRSVSPIFRIAGFQ
jgi:hypothetical protein